MADLETQGIVEQVPTVSAAISIVLVAEGQTGQNYPLCTNFTDLNALTKVRFYPIPELVAVRDQFAYSCVFSAMDMKSRFLNVPVKTDSTAYFGLTT